MVGSAENPFSYLLIVNHDPRFGEKGDETVSDAEFSGGLPAILGPTRTPKVKFGPIGLELSYMIDHGRHRNAGGSHTADQGVIDINVNNHRLVPNKHLAYPRWPISASFASPSLQATSCGGRLDFAAMAATTPAASPMETEFPVTR